MHFRWNQVLVRIAEGGFVVPLILLCDSTTLNNDSRTLILVLKDNSLHSLGMLIYSEH